MSKPAPAELPVTAGPLNDEQYCHLRSQRLLKHSPCLATGTVTKGFQRGSSINFPTANIAFSEGSAFPDGVYGGFATIVDSRVPFRCQALGHCPSPALCQRLPVVLSIGTNPTFDDCTQRTLETHFIGKAFGDLYGMKIHVVVLCHLRGMVRFSGLEELKQWIHGDASFWSEAVRRGDAPTLTAEQEEFLLAAPVIL
jgi:FAD synthase